MQDAIGISLLVEPDGAAFGQESLDHLLALAVGTIAPDDLLGPCGARNLLDPLFKRRGQGCLPGSAGTATVGLAAQ